MSKEQEKTAVAKKSEKQEVASKDKKREVEEELSEEDQQLKDSLESLVEKLTLSNSAEYEPSLDKLKHFLRESTSSMTAIPKPLVFLQPHYETLITLFTNWKDSELKSKFADILSILGSSNKKMDALKYRLLSKETNICEWGHEYVRHLTLEIGEEYSNRLEKDEDANDLIELAKEIVPFFLEHNGEADAVDLLLEIESIGLLTQFVDKNTYSRVCLYMVSCVPLLAPPDDLNFLRTAHEIYLLHNELPQALALAIRLDDEKLISKVFYSTDDVSIQKQMAFMLARQNSPFKHEDKEIQDITSNMKLSEYFKYLVSELNLLEPKVPEDYYKSHLENSKFSEVGASMDSAKQNLASNFVNAFINLGYCNDKIMSEDDSKSFIYRTKGNGMLSTTASLGTIYQWNQTDGLQEADKYSHSKEVEIQAGGLLAMGIASNGIHDYDLEATFMLLSDPVQSESRLKRIAAIVGLGIAFAGSQNEDVLELLLPIVSDTSISLEIASIAALTLGHVFVGTSNGEIVSVILQTFLERDLSEFNGKWVKLLSLGLGLLYIGNHDSIEEALETISAIEHPISKSLEILVTACAFAGTGNVLQIQKLLSMCLSKPEDESGDEDEEEEEEENEEAVAAALAEAGASTTKNTESTSAPAAGDGDVDMDTDTEADKNSEDSAEKEKKLNFDSDETYKAYAVLGIAMIAMGEEVGQDMSLRHFGHLMHYGNTIIKKAVPLAMGLVSASNPQMKVYETLSRYSHDADTEIAFNSIYSMGVVGAGTNNARLSQLLRQLAGYYSKHSDTLFGVRIAQGLVHLGKGTLSLNPFSNDRQILSKVNLASLLTINVLLLEPKDFILSDSHYLLYYLSSAIHPRMLVTVDEDLNPLKVNVRVGQAVDTVGQAGKPKTITGWVTQETPVLLGYGERAELESDEYLPLANNLEGIVILRKNPDYMEIDG